jgi:hypothetical protein
VNTKTVIIAGSRTITDYELLKQTIENSPWFGRIDTVFTGDARGVDAMAVRWAKENGITFRIFKADWSFYGRGAGPERNKDMIIHGGEALILLWDGKSKGSKNMLGLAKRFGLPFYSEVIGS